MKKRRDQTGRSPMFEPSSFSVVCAARPEQSRPELQVCSCPCPATMPLLVAAPDAHSWSTVRFLGLSRQPTHLPTWPLPMRQPHRVMCVGLRTGGVSRRPGHADHSAHAPPLPSPTTCASAHRPGACPAFCEAHARPPRCPRTPCALGWLHHFFRCAGHAVPLGLACLRALMQQIELRKC